MTSRSEPPVTVCMPSNRPLATAGAAIDSAIAYTGRKGYRLAISDNSGDWDKASRYRDVPAHVDYLLRPGLGPTANLLAAVEAAKTPFVLPMGDDDLLTADEAYPDFDYGALPDDVIGVRPRLEVFAIGEGVLRSNIFTIDAEQPSARLDEYRRKINGDNSLYYSAFRRIHFQEIMTLFHAHHPTRMGDADWGLVYSLVLTGRIACDLSTRYAYDIGRWRRTDGIAASISEQYANAGLPERAIAFSPLLQFIDCYVLTFRPGLAIDPVEREKALYNYAIHLVGPFLRRMERQPALAEGCEAEIDGLRQSLKAPGEALAAVFEAAAQVAENLKPGLYQRCLNWYAAVAEGRSDAGPA